MTMAAQTRKFNLDGIPVVLLVPEHTAGELVLWLTHLGGSAQQTLPMLQRFAAAGHPAVSFDPPLQGARSPGGDAWAFAGDVLAAFRRRMWPILGQTTLEAMRVLTWAQEQTGQDGTALVGGVSMGGDVAIALAGIDDRVRRVATVGSTPDWSRPDMRELQDPTTVLDQGEPDRYAQWFANHLDPSRHLDRYTRDLPIAFELGQQDFHIPTGNAEQFRDRLSELAPDAPYRIRIQTYAGLDHLGVTTNAAALTAAFTWLTEPHP